MSPSVKSLMLAKFFFGSLMIPDCGNFTPLLAFPDELKDIANLKS